MYVSRTEKEDFRTLVLVDRTWELLFKIKRWYDIERRKIGFEVFSEDGLEGFKQGFGQAQNYLYPIPADELARNPKLIQNPAY